MGCIKFDILENQLSTKKTLTSKESDFFTRSTYLFGFNGMEKDPEITGEQGSHYTTTFRAYDSRIGRWWSVDPKTQKFPWQSPYLAMNNNPINWVDSEGDEPLPTINQILLMYGYETREDQLFPEPTTLIEVAQVANAVKGLLDPTTPVWLSIGKEYCKIAVDINENVHKNPEKAKRKNLNQYYKNLNEVSTTIKREIKQVNNKIKALEEREEKTGNTGFHREEIASQIRLRWELEDRQSAVELEKEEIEPIVESTYYEES